MSCDGLQLKISTTRTKNKTLMGSFSENEYEYACAVCVESSFYI